MSDPYVVTVLVDTRAQEHFDTLRRRHFPPGRTAVGAHVTVFHQLPGDRRGQPTADVVREVLAALRPAPSAMTVTGVRSLGRGVAYVLEAPGVAPVRARLADALAADLTPQDRQPWRPHVTVQNKVEPAAARALLAGLAAGFVPFTVHAEGLALWRYRGGPWELESEHPFAG